MKHLHWLHRLGKKAMKDVSSAMPLCGKGPVEAAKVTSEKSEATCPRCLELAAEENGR